MGRETNKQRRERQAQSARAKAAAARAEQRRAAQRRRAVSILGGVVAIVIVGVLIAVFAINSGGGKTSNDRTPASPQVVSTVTGISPATLQSIGKGGASFSVQPTSGDQPLTANGKPELLYVGGEFCPYCAAERWALVQALSRFGTFSNLSQTRSAPADGDVATFSFYKSTYTSKYLAFTPVENQDRNHDTLEPLSSAQQAVMTKYTTGYPFLDFGGKYYQKQAGYNYSDLGGKSQLQIAQQLKDPTSKIAQDIVGEANNLTAAICAMTGNRPAKVCNAPAVTALRSQLGA